MILRAAWILPISSPPIQGGILKVVGNRIAEVGTAETVSVDDETLVDLGRSVLMPGLVNPHTHLELTGYAGRLEPGPLWRWLKDLIKMRHAPGEIAREQEGVREGAWQSLRHGVTCVGDISRRNLNWRVLKPIPIRKVCFVELLALAADPPRNVDELREAIAQIEEDDLLTAGVSPHAPYTASAAQIRGAVSVAREMQRPWCTHWAETPEEVAFLAGDDSGLPQWLRDAMTTHGVASPRIPALDYLTQCVNGEWPGALAHFNVCGDADPERLAAAGHTVVFCPRAHRFFQHEPHPYRRLIDAGVTVAIGTDSAASNDDLSLLAELRYLREQTPDAPPCDELLRMTTLHAARALRLDDRIGTLEPGKEADLVAFNCPRDTTDPSRAVVEDAAEPVGVWVAGRRAI